jgi:hypothetical protein
VNPAAVCFAKLCQYQGDVREEALKRRGPRQRKTGRTLMTRQTATPPGFEYVVLITLFLQSRRFAIEINCYNVLNSNAATATSGGPNPGSPPINYASGPLSQ